MKKKSTLINKTSLSIDTSHTPTRFFSSPSQINRITNNPFQRYNRQLPSSSNQAYILIHNTSDKQRWGQFDSLETLDSTRFRPISQVKQTAHPELIEALSPRGTRYQGDLKRALTVTLNNGFSGKVLPLSPARTRLMKNKIKLFQHAPPKKTTLKSHSIIISAAALKKSSRKKCSGKSTRDVMKGTASHACRHYLQQNKENLTNEGTQFLHALANDYEWLHAIAKSMLASLSQSQHANNLGAASADENTRMMIVEKYARIFARYPNMSVKVNVVFTLFDNSDCIQSIDYTLEIIQRNASPAPPSALTVHTHSDIMQPKECPRSTDKLMISVLYDLLQHRSFARQGPVIASDQNLADSKRTQESKQHSL